MALLHTCAWMRKTKPKNWKKENGKNCHTIHKYTHIYSHWMPFAGHIYLCEPCVYWMFHTFRHRRTFCSKNRKIQNINGKFYLWFGMCVRMCVCGKRMCCCCWLRFHSYMVFLFRIFLETWMVWFGEFFSLLLLLLVANEFLNSVMIFWCALEMTSVSLFSTRIICLTLNFLFVSLLRVFVFSSIADSEHTT